MAGQKISESYCWEIELAGLNICMASSKKGAVHVGISLHKQPDAFKYYEDRFSKGRVTRNKEMNLPLMESIKAVLKGEPAHGELTLDIHCTPFQRITWETVALIPFGETRTYGEVSTMIMGRPAAARAVGQAMYSNPLPLIFP